MNMLIRSIFIFLILLRGMHDMYAAPCEYKYLKTEKVTSKVDCARMCATLSTKCLSFGYKYKECVIKRMSRQYANMDSWIFYRKGEGRETQSGLIYFKKVRSTSKQDMTIQVEAIDVDSGMLRKCHHGGSYVAGYCMVFLFKMNRFCQSKWLCNKLGMRMVEVESEVKFHQLAEYLSRTTSKDIWLGGTDKVKRGYWKWLEPDQPVGYTNWATQKGVSYLTKRCISVGAKSNYKWVKTICLRRKELVCEYRWDNLIFPAISPDGKFSLKDDCEHDGKKYKASCYVSHQISVDWFTALKNCEQWNMNLVSITSQNEHDFLQYYLKYTYSTDVSRCIWIGLNDRRREETWEWQGRNESVIFKNWAAGEPGHVEAYFSYPDDCVVLNKQRQWEDRNCQLLCDFMCELTRDQ